MRIISLRISDTSGFLKPSLEDGSPDYSLVTLKVSNGDEELELILRFSYIPWEEGADFCEEGRELASHEWEAICFAAQCFKAEGAALRLAARAEQCVAGLTLKLRLRGYDRPFAEAATAYLSATGAVDDGRYAKLWLESQIARGTRSPRHLAQALRSKGISRNTAETALGELLEGDEETALLRRFLEKRKGFLNRRDLRRTLRYEGFSPEAIETYLESEE